MGEARYYMRVRFADADAAEEAAPRIEAFLRRMKAAEDFWQAHRSEAGFESALREHFADVFEILPVPGSSQSQLYANDPSNYYAGQLDSPAGATVEEDFDFEINPHDNYVEFAGTVWHFADWELLTQAMKHFGARAAGWVSDEYAEIDYYGMTAMAPLA